MKSRTKAIASIRASSGARTTCSCVAALAETRKVFSLLGIEDEPTESVTVAGFVAELVGRIPRVGDSVDHNGFRYIVLRASARRAERIEIRRLGSLQPEE